MPEHRSYLCLTSQSLLEAPVTKAYGGSLDCNFMLNPLKVDIKFVIFTQLISS